MYSPNDLISVEMVNWRQRQKTNIYAFDALGINPLHEYKVTIRALKISLVDLMLIWLGRTLLSCGNSQLRWGG